MAREYEAVIGLEVHSELKTKSKIFCSCSTEFGGAPNSHVCEICLGLPGVLPVLNKKVVDYAIKAGLATNCQINKFNKFDRKNYYYPDLSKNFQTSQFDLPICESGHLDIEIDGEIKRIRINRIHMEEDAGKLVHSGATISTSHEGSLVDYNRGGVPLIEIVSEPDMRSAEEARLYMETLRSILQYVGVSDCKMEEGSLRCDANISVRLKGETKLGTKAEIKNMNSFKSLQGAIEYEIERQIELIEDGGQVIQETRTWDEAKGITLSMRSKEEAHDYRYFPEPDLVPVEISSEWIERIKAEIPELPQAKKKRLIEELGLSAYDAELLVASKDMANYFDATLNEYKDAKVISNWLMGDVTRILKENNAEIKDMLVKPADLGELLQILESGSINNKIAKQVFEEMYKTGKKAGAIIAEKGLVQISDEGLLESVIVNIIANNPQSVADYKGGKKQAVGFLVGQVMKETKGKANPGLVNKLLAEKLEEV